MGLVQSSIGKEPFIDANCAPEVSLTMGPLVEGDGLWIVGRAVGPMTAGELKTCR